MITQEEIPPFTKEECKAMIKTIYQHRKEKKELLDKAIKFFQSKSKHGMIEENINEFINEFCKEMGK